MLVLVSILVLLSKPHNLPNQKSETLSDLFINASNSSGVHDFLVTDSKNSYGLRLITPADTMTAKPLVLGLHWAGRGEIFKTFSSCLVEPAFKKLDAYVIVLDAEEQVWYTPKNEKKVLALMEAAFKHWKVDRAKVIVTGYSDGGNGSWYFAEYHPDIFKAAIPIASSYLPNSRINVPVYMIHGNNDELFNADDSKSYALRSKKQGTDVTIRMVNDLSHYEACAYWENLRASIPWLKKKLAF